MAGPVISLAELEAFVMARRSETLGDHGVEGDHEEAVNRLIELMGNMYRGVWSLDELLLRPREALRYCDAARTMLGNFDVPDDVILRSVMRRRKNPS